MFHFGFSYIGLIWLLMLFVPNIIWTKNKPSGYEESEKKENKILLIFERVGQALVTVSFLLMVFYELYWIRYFKSERTMKDFYSSFLGVPVAGAESAVREMYLKL